MINFGSVVCLVAMIFWWLASLIAKASGKKQAADWMKRRIQWCNHRGQAWDQGGPVWSWSFYNQLRKKCLEYGINDPNLIPSCFSYLARVQSHAKLAKMLGLKPEQTKSFFREMEEWGVLRWYHQEGEEEPYYCLR